MCRGSGGQIEGQLLYQQTINNHKTSIEDTNKDSYVHIRMYIIVSTSYNIVIDYTRKHS